MVKEPFFTKDKVLQINILRNEQISIENDVTIKHWRGYQKNEKIAKIGSISPKIMWIEIRSLEHCITYVV